VVADSTSEAIAGAIELSLVAVEDSDNATRPLVSGWKDLRGPAFSLLGLATVFTLNALLSQPIAGFDYLSSRFDQSGNRSGSNRGKSRDGNH
jgi:hypothetical protein